MPIPTASAAGRPEPSTRSARLEYARLFAELARRAAAPFDALPVSDSSRALVVLWKEAAFWALSACADAPPSTPDLPTVLQAAPREVVVRAAGGAEWLPSIEKALALDPREVAMEHAATSPARQAAILETFTRALISELDAPERERARQRAFRLSKRAGLVLGGVLLCAAAYWLWLRPNRAASAIVTTSSDLGPCRSPGDCGNALFHTKEEDRPWVMYDLGSEYELHSVDVQNRSDCCYERAVPLVVETSHDANTWTEQARAERAFLTWSTSLRTRTRYVRLRVDRRSYLHLGPVVIR